MLSWNVPLRAALSGIEAELTRCESEVVPLDAALDRVLACDLMFDAAQWPAGHRLSVSDLGLLAALGRTTIAVVRRPRVAVLATGDELAAPGRRLRYGQISNSSTALVSACVRRWGGRPMPLGIATDRVESLRKRLEQGIEHSADLIVTVGGTGRGDRDFLRSLLAAEGVLIFDGVAMRGGQTTMFGRYRGCPVFALPGPPSACRLTLETFVRPAVLRLGGRPSDPVTVPARVTKGFRARSVLSFEWARVTPNGAEFEARRLRGPGIGPWTSMLLANALLVVPAEVTIVETGDILEARLLDVPLESPQYA